MEGRTPVYCIDEARTKVYRRAFRMREIKDTGPRSVNKETHPPYTRLCRREPYVFPRWDVDWDGIERVTTSTVRGFSKVPIRLP